MTWLGADLRELKDGEVKDEEEPEMGVVWKSSRRKGRVLSSVIWCMAWKWMIRESMRTLISWALEEVILKLEA